MNTIARRTALAAPVLALVLLAPGCGGRNVSPTSFEGVAGNLSPDKRGMQQRPIDVRRHLAITNDSDVRALSDDLGRTFYTDHPSRLSPYPIVSLNGQPR